MLFFTLITMEGHHFAFLENILCYTSINRKLHEHPIHFNTRNYQLINKRNVATSVTQIFSGNTRSLRTA